MKKINKDEKWFDVVQQIRWRDDNTCQLWNILFPEEKKYLQDVYSEDFFINILDCAHIIPKSERPDLYYDLDNIVLICRLFHNRLDEFRHPITNNDITKEERLQWLRLAKEKYLFYDGKGLILKDKVVKDMNEYIKEKSYERDEVYDLYKKLSDKQLKKVVLECVDHKMYKPDDFTELVKNILKFEHFSEKQRKVLIKHLGQFEEMNSKED